MAINDFRTVLSSAQRSDATHTSNAFDSIDYRGVRLILDITAKSGSSPTLDVKVQTYDAVSANWVDLPGAAFAQKNDTGRDDLTIYPGIAETANETVSDHIGPKFRVHGTIGGTSTPTFTYSVGAQLLI